MRQKLGARLGRIRGQLDAVERAMGERRDLAVILQTMAACRGAMSGLISEVIEAEMRDFLQTTSQATPEERVAATEHVLKLVRTYLK